MGASALAITLSLYIMDHIRKTEVMQSESLRMAWSMLGWTVGPALGVFLYTRFGVGCAACRRACLCHYPATLFWRSG